MAIETRDEMTQQIRNRALFEFGKYGKTPEVRFCVFCVHVVYEVFMLVSSAT